MITSASNPQVKNIALLNQKARERKSQGLFAVEGFKMFQEAPPSWVQKVYVSEDCRLAGDAIACCRDKGYPWETVSPEAAAKMSDTQTPQGLVTLLKLPFWEEKDIFGGESASPLLAVLEDVQDPGNVGTIFRTAEAAGASGILLTRGCADVTAPKTVRSTMGSIYRVPYLYLEGIEACASLLCREGIGMFAAHLDGKHSYDEEDYRKPAAFLIGNEGNGLSERASRLADSLIRIPMSGHVESLNAAMAAGILMYEASRQRHHA